MTKGFSVFLIMTSGSEVSVPKGRRKPLLMTLTPNSITE